MNMRAFTCPETDQPCDRGQCTVARCVAQWEDQTRASVARAQAATQWHPDEDLEKVVSIRMTPDLQARLREYARIERRPMSQMANILLEQAMADRAAVPAILELTPPEPPATAAAQDDEAEEPPGHLLTKDDPFLLEKAQWMFYLLWWAANICPQDKPLSNRLIYEIDELFIAAGDADLYKVEDTVIDLVEKMELQSAQA